jgi:transposase
MNNSPKKTYLPWNPDLYRQQSYAPLAKLPQGDLVFFLLDVVPSLDLTSIYAPYEDETRGAPPYDPAMMVCLLLYAYCVGVFSSRKIAKACERNLAFLVIVGDERPDFRTISDFRKLHIKAFADVFVAVLRLAKELGMVKLGNLATDGTKMPGNASRHKAMSYGYMLKQIERLREEITALVQQAQSVDAEDDAALGSRRGDELPDELQRREQRLATIQTAKARLEEQAKAAAEAQRQERAQKEAERQRSGKKRRGKEPKPIDDTPDDKAQTNFTDPELKIMPQNNKGWEYSANAQATVDSAHQIILACLVTTASNDKEQAVPMAEATKANMEKVGLVPPTNPDAAGEPKKIPNCMDTGYFSKEAIQGVEALGFDPHIATERQRHHAATPASEPLTAEAVATPASEPLTAEAVATPASEPLTAEAVATPVSEPLTTEAAATPASEPSAAEVKEKMAAKLQTVAGKALYARRKVIVEPVFGQIKGARGFRRFLLRGLEKIGGEWNLLCLTHNLLKIWRYLCAPSAS